MPGVYPAGQSQTPGAEQAPAINQFLNNPKDGTQSTAEQAPVIKQCHGQSRKLHAKQAHKINQLINSPKDTVACTQSMKLEAIGMTSFKFQL